ncbi:MAG: GumC family protein [Candidatus Krumholzibacteriia bacterium]
MDERAATPSPRSSMELPLTAVLHVLWTRWILILVCIAGALLPVFLLNRWVARVYEAETTVVIRNGSEQLDATDLLRTSLDRSFILDLVEEIRSRSVAEQVLEALPEEARTELLATYRGGPEDRDAWVVRKIRKQLRPELVRETDVIRIRAHATNPELAATLANAAARVIGRRNLETKRSELTGLREFIETQIHLTDTRLQQSEEELNTFKQLNQVVTLEKEAEAILERITNVESELHLAATELTGMNRELQALRRELQRQRKDLPTSVTEFTSPYIAELKLNLVQLQMRHTRLRMQEYAEDHPELAKLRGEIESTRSKIEAELKKIAASSDLLDPMTSIQKIVERQIELEISTAALDARVRSLEAVRNAYQMSLSGFPEKELQLMRLTRTNKLEEKIYMMLLEKREEARIAEAAKMGNVRVLDLAVPPSDPIRPRTKLNLALAGIVGFLVGASLALRRHVAERVIRTTRELLQFPQLTVLGGVPRLAGRRRRAEPEQGDPSEFPLFVKGKRSYTFPSSTSAGEAYRCLRTSLHHVASRGLPRSILVTSPGPQEGKSTTALNTALSLALSGVSTCLVDADLRRPMLHYAFGSDLEPGLANQVESELPLEPVVRQTPYANLSLLPAGRSTMNPAELLEAPRLGALLGLLSQRYRVVILDAPPVIPVTDPAILAPCVDRVLMVIYAGRTRVEGIEHAVEILRTVGIEEMHAVLNGIGHPDYYGKYSRYYKHYVAYYHKASA